MDCMTCFKKNKKTTTSRYKFIYPGPYLKLTAVLDAEIYIEPVIRH